jgi:hypothetical protein
MVSELLQTLGKHTDDPVLGETISRAIDFVLSSTVERERASNGPGESSRSIADIHAFRKRSGYYAKASIQGLDETIDGLRSKDVPVWFNAIETDRGTVAIWVDGQGLPLGILILKKVKH